jgi:hypothetical protein
MALNRVSTKFRRSSGLRPWLNWPLKPRSPPENAAQTQDQKSRDHPE